MPKIEIDPSWPPDHWGAPSSTSTSAPPLPPNSANSARARPQSALSPEHEREFQLWRQVAKVPPGADPRAQWLALRADLAAAHTVRDPVSGLPSPTRMPMPAGMRYEAPANPATTPAPVPVTSGPESYYYMPDRGTGGSPRGDEGDQ